MNEKTKELLTRYNAELIKMNIKGKRCEDFCGETGLRGLNDEQIQICHLKWMLDEMLDNASEWSDTKTNRWLGFVQGILWCVKFRGILELRTESMQLNGK